MNNILAIETSCDETAVAIVREGRDVLVNLVSSQVDTHALYGGVVPEIASRQHLLTLTPLIRQALDEAQLGWHDIAAVAVTKGPGLVGALLIGVATAKAIAYALDKPLVSVNHMAGHIYANMLGGRDIQFPLLCLVVSGGHTDLVYMQGDLDFKVLAQTRDDAAGEAFDKVARVLGLGYPGGPHMDRLAQTGSPELDFPRTSFDDSFDFSFSGLKTAVINHVHRQEQRGEEVDKAIVAASFQQAVVDVLVENTVRAAREYKPRSLLVAGGVAANTSLRSRMQEAARHLSMPLFVPPLELCTDNAAMIAAAAWPRYVAGARDGLDLNAAPGFCLAEGVENFSADKM